MVNQKTEQQGYLCKARHSIFVSKEMIFREALIKKISQRNGIVSKTLERRNRLAWI